MIVSSKRLGKTVSTRKRAPPLKIFFYEFDENDSATCIFALLCATTYLGLLELRFRGGELRGGRRDGEHGFYLINRVCVYEDSLLQKSHRERPFFFSFSFERKQDSLLV
jgi:hypothetical protein